jgi:hypothetical protein
MPRYVAAVKAAKDYIEKNYIVSGGNYFRKNADGSAGDDVSGVHGSGSNDPTLGEIDSIEIDENSYAEARGDYEKFDQMMQNGIGNYIVNADISRLVKFLVGGFSENYKLNVLKALQYNKSNGGEPADMQQALALGRNKMESVFDKFDKLTLEEQLIVLEQSKVLERPLSKGEEKDKEKYVKGMKKNAKDFKKRYGKDAKAVMYATATKMAKESITEDGVPNNDRVSLLNTLLADHLPASDLQKQFHAYWAIPVPAMLDAFRDARAQGGDNTCLRPILRAFAERHLSANELKKINLNEK